MKKIFLIIAPILFALTGYCQKPSSQIYVGDQMPDYKFPTVYQYSKKTFHLNEMKGKLLILDFWATSCHSCVELFPHMQKLQDYFKDKIQIILVTDWKRNDFESINHTLVNVKKNLGITITLPVTAYDSVLTSYFPHRGIPHEVIIDQKGKVIAITNGEEITKENIQAVLDGQKVNFHLKNDFLNRNLPLVVNTNRNNNAGILMSSSLTKYYPSVGANGIKVNEKKEVIGQGLAFNLLDAYKVAYQSMFNEDPTVVIFETNDSTIRNNSILFNYDLIVQNCKFSEDLFEKCLQKDLDICFNFSFHREIKNSLCLIAKVNQNISKYFSTATSGYDGNLVNFKESTKNHVVVYGRNVGVGGLLFDLNANASFNTIKIIDESGLGKQAIDIDFPLGFDFNNKEKFIAFLHEKGIDLTVENREIPVVIVSDKKPGEPTVIQ